MRRTIYKLIKPEVMEMFEEELPSLSKEEILLKPYRLSICNADFRYYKGLRSQKVLDERLPMALIHEGVGTVEEDLMGEYKKGDMVLMLPNILHQCDEDCHIRENYNPKATFLSSKGDGFLATHIILPRQNVIKIKENIDLSIASFVEPLSVATQLVNEKGNIFERAKQVSVWGDGNLGFSVALILKHFFPHLSLTIVGINEQKLSLFNFVENRIKIEDSYTVPSFDVGIEVVGSKPSEMVINDIIRFIKPMGHIILMGVSEEKIGINTRDILEKGLILHGISRSSREDFERTLDFLELKENQEELKKIIYEEIKINNIDDIHKAFFAFAAGKGKVIMDFNL